MSSLGKRKKTTRKTRKNRSKRIKGGVGTPNARSVKTARKNYESSVKKKKKVI